MKVKVRHEGVFLVGGFRNVDALGGILVGERVDGRLHFRGVVEWSYRAPDVLTVLQHAKDFPLRTSPFVDTPRMSTRRGCDARRGWSRGSGRKSATRRSWRGGFERRRGDRR